MAEDHAIGARRAAIWMIAVNQAESLYAHEIAHDSRNPTDEFRIKHIFPMKQRDNNPVAENKIYIIC